MLIQPMDTREKTRNTVSDLEKEFEISESVLEQTYKDFMLEQKPTKAKKGVVNTATVMGLVMLVLVVIWMMQQLGLVQGNQIDFLLHIVPLIGGVTIFILGMGWFSNRKERKERKKAQKEFKKRISRMAQKNTDYDSYALKQKKKLYKSRTDKKLFGVCGGIGEYLGIDSTFVRIAFVLATISLYGSTLFIYILMAFLLSPKPQLITETD